LVALHCTPLAVQIGPENLNSEWWRLREELQGVHSPVAVTEDQFHPGAKYHIPANVPYIR
jgi:peptidyl-dipeptidase A